MKIKNLSVSENSLRKIIGKAKDKKPQFGNSRSFSCNSTRKNWKCNKQKFTVGGKSYMLPWSEIKTINKKLKVGETKKAKDFWKLPIKDFWPKNSWKLT